jgi:hypothetical protein
MRCPSVYRAGRSRASRPAHSPLIQVARDEFRTVVAPDRFWIAKLLAGTFECLNHVGAFVSLSYIQRCCIPRERVDNREHADRSAIVKPVVQKIQ